MTAALRLVRDVEPEPGGLNLLPAQVLSCASDGEAVFARVEGAGLRQHERALGSRPDAAGQAGDQLLGMLDELALTGRGGGHFPVAAKWRAARSAGGGGLVVGNGAEGEPASAKDAALLQHRPHLVLDGLALTAEAVGATEAVLWLHEGALASHFAVMRALAERRSHQLADPPFRVVTGPDRYLSGESSAIVRALSGGPALPAFTRTPAAERGVADRPTVVQNVETLARVGLIARQGVRAYQHTALVTVALPDRRAVVELADGEPLRSALELVGEPDPSAVLLGGYGGSWLPWQRARDLGLGDLALREAGVSLGAGVLAPLPVGACGLVQTAVLLDYLAGQSARQCGPCVFGLPALAGLFSSLAAARASDADRRRLVRYSQQVSGRGACHHPDGAARLAQTALQVFAGDVEQHLRGAACAGASRRPTFPVPGAVG